MTTIRHETIAFDVRDITLLPAGFANTLRMLQWRLRVRNVSNYSKLSISTGGIIHPTQGDRLYGSMQAYLEKALHIDEPKRTRLRELLLESG